MKISSQMVRLFALIALLIIHKSIFYIIIITAKFNCTVSGTLSDFSDECNISMTTSNSPSSPTMIANSVVSTGIKNMVNEFNNSSNPDILSVLLMILVGCIVIFTLCVTIVCSVFTFQRIKQKRQSHTFFEGQTVMQDNLTMNALHHLQEEQQQNHYGI